MCRDNVKKFRISYISIIIIICIQTISRFYWDLLKKLLASGKDATSNKIS